MEKGIRLVLKRCIAPSDRWYWAVLLGNGHVWATSKQSFESASLCAADVVSNGLPEIDSAEAARATSESADNGCCRECGMQIDKSLPYYHPYAACLMYKACNDNEVVQANLDAAIAHGAMLALESCKEAESQCYASLSLELIRPNSLYEGIETLRDRLSVAEAGQRRFDALSKLGVTQFAELRDKSASTGVPLEQLVDEMTAVQTRKAEAVLPDTTKWVGMESPTFESDGSPTEETLAAIVRWQPDFEQAEPWAKLIQFCREAWNMDYGTIREEQGKVGGTVWCFVTGGWSDNESIQFAMNENWLFRAMCWQESHRGGTVKYKFR